jgi:pimeloyl-ACP methyl ester carboxylesterase
MSFGQEVRYPAAPPDARGVIFAVDGAGGFHAMSDSLREAIALEKAPLGIEPVIWSHGLGRVLFDHTDWCHAREEGQRLAAQVAVYRQSYPNRAVHIMAHSAGCAVALTAAEMLPPHSLDRLVLVAPTVSAGYDLRSALRACRGGLEVYYSSRDMAFLGLGIAILGTADRHWESAAGRVGFRPQNETPEDAALFTRLHQHPWDACLSWTGNRGGHYGGHAVNYLRIYVLPMLVPTD